MNHVYDSFFLFSKTHVVLRICSKAVFILILAFIYSKSELFFLGNKVIAFSKFAKLPSWQVVWLLSSIRNIFIECDYHSVEQMDTSGFCVGEFLVHLFCQPLPLPVSPQTFSQTFSLLFPYFAFSLLHFSVLFLSHSPHILFSSLIFTAFEREVNGRKDILSKIP